MTVRAHTKPIPSLEGLIDPEKLSAVASTYAFACRLLGDPIRVQTLLLLGLKGETLVSDLSNSLGEMRGSLSYHLRLLSTAGLISSRRVEGNTRYRLTEAGRTRLFSVIDAGPLQ